MIEAVQFMHHSWGERQRMITEIFLGDEKGLLLLPWIKVHADRKTHGGFKRWEYLQPLCLECEIIPKRDRKKPEHMKGTLVANFHDGHYYPVASVVFTTLREARKFQILEKKIN